MSDKRWESLCEKVAFAKTYGTEAPLHFTLESEFTTNFKWPKKHVKHEPSVNIGSRKGYADTVLEGDGFGIIIEAKAPGVGLGENQKNQLISYMELYKTERDNVKCDYGFLIRQRDGACHRFLQWFQRRPLGGGYRHESGLV